jgi:electron transfer flavoprotein beta subunit
MNIIVCVKDVPNPVLPVEFDIEKNYVKDTEWNYILNPYDEVALEEALRLKDKFGGTVTALSLGISRTESVLRKCLAMGADKAIHLSSDVIEWDAYTIALKLAKVIAQLSFDIVFCGLRSMDRNGGEVGSMLAEILGIPVVTAIISLEVDIDKRSALVARRLERGAREIKRCPLPALFTADLMLNEPRYPTLPDIKKAASQGIEYIESNPADSSKLLDSIGPLTRITGISRPPPKKIFIPTGNLSPAERIRLLTQGTAAKKSSGNLLEGDPDDIARKFIQFLVVKRLLS